MLKKPAFKSDSEILRQKAEELLKKKTTIPVIQLSDPETLKLIHELQVHQIELERQNEELKSRNEELRESEVRFRLVSDNAPVLIWKSGTDALCDYFNKPWLMFTGRTMEQEMGNGWTEGVHPDDFQRCLDTYLGAFKAQQPFIMEYRLRRYDGEYRWLLDHGVPRFSPNGQFTGYIGSCMDITESKQALMLLEQTRHNYETFHNTIDDLLFVLDEQGNIIHTNSTVIDRLGYTTEELSGQSVLIIHPPDRREEAGRIVGEMLGGVTAFCPVPVISKSGIQIPVETRVSRGVWDGKPAIFGVTKDISKLRLSEEKFSKLFHLNPSACGTSDLDNHTYLEVNEAFYTLFGFDRDEVIGKTAFDLGILTVETANLIYSTADTTGRIANAEVSLKAKNGEIRHVVMSAENFYVQDKKYRFTVVQDITRQKQAQVQMEQIAARLSLATRAGGVGIWDLDVVNNILTWDDQMYSLYGIQKSNSAGGYDTWLNGLHPDDVKRGDMEIQAVLRGEKEFNTEFRVKWPDGTVRNIRAMAIVQREEAGKPLHMIGTNWDITSQKQIEQELRESRENLQKINAEKNRFFSIIAHDLRGPFNGFLGFTEMMVADLPGMSQAELEKIARLMRNSALNLFNLLENLLEWARLHQNLITINCDEVKLFPAVNESIAIASGAAIRKGIDITNAIPESLLVFADRNVIQTVLRNLVSNAVKFTCRGGKVGISARATSEDSVEVSIKDTGIGMSRTMVKELFLLDAHTGRRGTDGEPSTGLGLILCRDFIEKSGGRLWVESEEGAGTTFYFTLPDTK